jgi:uridine kinase
MIGDKVIYLPQHYVKRDMILEQIPKLKSKKKRMITIGGESGTGKTEVSRLLQEKFWNRDKVRCKVIHLDDYYITSWGCRNKVRQEKGIDSVGISEIDWNKLKNIITTFFSNSKKLYVQKIHKYTDSLEYSIARNDCIDILIFEGLYAFNLCQPFRKDCCISILLEGNYSDTEFFRKKRKKEKQTELRQQVLMREHEEVEKLSHMAKIRIPYHVPDMSEE